MRDMNPKAQRPTYSAALSRLHKEAGLPSFRKIERQLVLKFGESAPPHEQIRRYHQGLVKSPDRATLGMLAWYYDVDPEEIDAGTARVLLLLGAGRHADPTGPAGRERHAGNITDQQTDPSTCMDHLAVQSAA